MRAVLRTSSKPDPVRRRALASIGALALASAGLDVAPALASVDESSNLAGLIARHKAIEAELAAVNGQIDPLQESLEISLRANPIVVVLGPGADQTLRFIDPGFTRQKCVRDATNRVLRYLSEARPTEGSLRDHLNWAADLEERNFQLVAEAEEALLDRMGPLLIELKWRHGELCKASNEAFARVRAYRPKNFAEVRAYIDHMGSNAGYGQDFVPTENEVNEIFAALSTSGLAYPEANE